MEIGVGTISNDLAIQIRINIESVVLMSHDQPQLHFTKRFNT